MNVAFGFKTHSGWAAVIVLGQEGNDFVVVDRRRIELVDEQWAKAPYHAAEGHEPSEARKLVARGIAQTRRVATREFRTIMKREQKRENKIQGCGIVVGNPMPHWTVDQILAVHFRMHKAEGVLFRETIADASERSGLACFRVHENDLVKRAQEALRLTPSALSQKIASLGKSIGAPWGKDQKEATLAAMIVLGRG